MENYYAIAIATLSDWVKEAKENQWYLVRAIFPALLAI